MKFCVIGIGSFGYQVATKLAENGIEVLAVDKSEDKINDIRDYVTHAICATIDDEDSLRGLGIEEVDTVIVGMGKSFAQSVLITALLKKKIGTSRVIARANIGIHKEILELIGADQVILPEQEMGIRLANTISSQFIDVLTIGKNFNISQIKAPQKFVGKAIEDLSFYKNYKVRCIGIKKDDEIVVTSLDHIIVENDILIFAGSNKALEVLTKIT
ncbi:TrkA family potassium uptake protein [bacterium]|mgnify:CR=1 FL=1|jgi:trk system potassium uptake protein|nr:TrkA family potassium uptake protein [bacterium]